MSTTTQTLGIILAGVVVILFYCSASVSGAIFGTASPMSFMIYVGEALTALWLGLIVFMSFGRTGDTN